MAGINTRIEEMTRHRSLSIIVTAYVYAALIVAGPWIFTMLSILSIGSVSCASPCVQLPLFRSIVIYNSLFALVTTSPLAFFAGRYVSDQICLGRNGHIFSAFLGCMAIFCAVALMTVVPFYFLAADLDNATRFLAVQNAVVIGLSWLLIPFMSAKKATVSILLAFAANAAVAAVAGATLRDPSVTILLAVFNIGFAITDMILLCALVRRFGSRAELDPELPRFPPSRWELPLAGLAYGIGIWSDKVLMWFGVPAQGLVMAGAIHTMPSYDTAMFWAQLSSIPVIAVAFIHVETQLHRLFMQFYGRVGQQSSLRELLAAMCKLQKCVISSIVTLFVALVIVAVMMMLVSFVFMDALGLRPSYMSILRVGLWAMAFHSSAMFCFVFLLYFDFRRQALSVVSIFAVTNVVLTVLFLQMGPVYYGYGTLIAAAVTFVAAFTIVLRELPWLHYHAFVTNNTSLQARPL